VFTDIETRNACRVFVGLPKEIGHFVGRDTDRKQFKPFRVIRCDSVKVGTVVHSLSRS
jgi:hypothetical protein